MVADVYALHPIAYTHFTMFRAWLCEDYYVGLLDARRSPSTSFFCCAWLSEYSVHALANVVGSSG